MVIAQSVDRSPPMQSPIISQCWTVFQSLGAGGSIISAALISKCDDGCLCKEEVYIMRGNSKFPRVLILYHSFEHAHTYRTSVCVSTNINTPFPFFFFFFAGRSCLPSATFPERCRQTGRDIYTFSLACSLHSKYDLQVRSKKHNTGMPPPSSTPRKS